MNQVGMSDTGMSDEAARRGRTPSDDDLPYHGDRPQYGEYATPEEQRARMGLPPTDAVAPAVAPVPAAAQPAPGVPGSVAGARPRRLIDRIATGVLLGYGLITTLTAIPQLIDYASFVDAFLAAVGSGSVEVDVAAGRPWGIAAALILGFGWLLTLGLSWMSLKAGRITWWIPLVAGIVFNPATGVLMMVPLMNEPAVWDAVLQSTQTAP